MDTWKVTRVEVIDHWSGRGRVFTLGPNETMAVEVQLQDHGRTLKVFLDKRQDEQREGGSRG